MKTAVYHIGDSTPFMDWLAANKDADCIEMKGTARLKQFMDFQCLAGLNGKTIDISGLRLRGRGKEWMPESYVLTVCLDKLDFGKDFETLPLIVILANNRGYAERCIVEDGVFYSEDRKSIVCIASNKAHLDLSSTSIVQIGRFAGYGNIDIERIIFPETLERIGDSAFARCENLKDVVFPKKMKSIGKSCFESTDIQKIVLPEGITEIPDFCFLYTLITDIQWPSTIRVIGYNALSFCQEEGEKDIIAIPEGVVEIKSEGLFGIRRVRFPSTLKFLAEDYYYEPIVGDQIGEPHVSVHRANPHFYSMNGKLYHKCKLVVRFEHLSDIPTSCQLVGMSEVEWRQFLGLRDENKRKTWMLHYLQMGDNDIKEMWWIPLFGQNKVTVNEEFGE